jgi:hypothetical protein
MYLKRIKSCNHLLIIILVLIVFGIGLSYIMRSTKEPSKEVVKEQTKEISTEKPTIQESIKEEEKINITKYFTFHMNSDETALILDGAYRDQSTGKIYTCPDTLILPNSLMYQGKEYKITAIGPGFDVPDNVRNLIIPEGIDMIDFAFCQESMGLETLSLPASLTKIEPSFLNLWDQDDTLKEIIIDEKNQSFKMIDGALYSFDGTVLVSAPLVCDTYTVLSGVTEIAPYSFSGNKKIKKVIIPDGVTTVGEYAFYECEKNLEEVVLPDGVETIGEGAFSACLKLSKINIPANLKEIPRSCFGYTAITEAIIPEGVTSIGVGAFAGCSSLTTIYLSSTVKSIDQSAFSMYEENNIIPAKVTIDSNNKYFKIIDGGLLSENGRVFYKLISSESTYTVPNTVTGLLPYAFSDASNARTVVLNNNIKVIGSHAFDRTDIKEVILPPTITKIDEYAFANSKITSINLPSGLTTIEAYAFYMGSLTELTIPATVLSIKMFALGKEGGTLKVFFEGKEPPSIEQQSVNPEDEGTTFALYVPEGSVSEYEKVFSVNNKRVIYTIK